ncbi:MAG: aldo/keto reductase [Moorea sp. SIOASIH]|uniref:aldo/keto reductase n=1 Tax=Moorena sp. SIOASIH TaxID=2607817 RepID=UPI0013B94E47|nr:aldo/keto reductase [Moorena sp. SIOASIH]NEO37999.1 aldo/keto reductase [Moorena sp. SIOASIH]
MDIQTLSGSPVSILGLGVKNPMDTTCVEIAYQAGINYFFFYNLNYTSFLEGLKPILAAQRDQVVVSTGSNSRDLNQLREYLDQVRSLLDVDTIDVFFLEYISPKDDLDQVAVALNQIHTWKTEGLIRYVGATTHNRQLAVQLLRKQSCDVLMHRYNMAHRKAEVEVFPAALKADIPVVAFTATRWGSLLQGHTDWKNPAPTAADCYRMVLRQPAIRLVLTAPKTESELVENLRILQSPELSLQEVTHWQTYGDLIYGTGQDSFDNQWP